MLHKVFCSVFPDKHLGVSVTHLHSSTCTVSSLRPRERSPDLSFSQSMHAGGGGWRKSRKSRGPTASEVTLTPDFVQKVFSDSGLPAATRNCKSFVQSGRRIGLQTKTAKRKGLSPRSQCKDEQKFPPGRRFRFRQITRGTFCEFGFNYDCLFYRFSEACLNI